MARSQALGATPETGVLYALWRKKKTAGTAYRQTECTGCPQDSLKGNALPLFYHKRQGICTAKFFLLFSKTGMWNLKALSLKK